MAMRGCAVLSPLRGIDDAQDAVDAATLIALRQCRRGDVPPIYESGVVYRRENHRSHPGIERIQTPYEAFHHGAEDCDGLASWRAGELLAQGELARAVVQPSSSGLHVVVRREDGTIEDPSIVLGMLSGRTEPLTMAGAGRRVRQMIKRARELVALAARANPASAIARNATAEAATLLRDARQTSREASAAARRTTARDGEREADELAGTHELEELVLLRRIQIARARLEAASAPVAEREDEDEDEAPRATRGAPSRARAQRRRGLRGLFRRRRG